MNARFRRSYGPRLVALVSFVLLSGSALFAEGEARADVPSGILKKYDKNKDGALDETEAAKWEADKVARREKDRKAREERLQKYDLNKDGKLSEDEKAAAKLAMEKERTEREMAKGREKAQERLAREKAEKAKSESEAATGASEMTEEKTSKDGGAKADDSMMMMTP